MSEQDQFTGTEIAIIGMAGRFPGAHDIATYWENVRCGIESIRRYSDEELLAAGVDPDLIRRPEYVKAGAPLDGMDLFDAGFFGFGPREAAVMDPQHRQFLEVAWEALEHAGYDSLRFDGSIGIYGGSGMNAYMPYNLLTNPQLMQSMGLFLVRHTGNDKDFLTTRVSYLLNLKGPSVNVQTACSTSLVAAHLASQALINGECDLALAGGVTIEMPHRQGYLYREDEILSPDGHCRSFDARSKGTVFGSGAGVVVLKRLEDALRAGDSVHAILRGSAVNNDGSGKVNYFAPSVDGQADVIAEALAVAGVDAGSIGYVEAHGTATPIGDPIEVAALTQAFRATTDQSGYCAIGSVKSNIGHLDTAAGVAGLIKTVQALKHAELPPSLHYERPNPAIDFEHSPFYVNADLKSWPRSGLPRRAGVSSLGVGGTNAHLVLEEAPPQDPSGQSRSWQLLMWSARTETALDHATTNLADYLPAHPEIGLADAAYTLQMGRRAFDQRRIAVVRNAGDLAEAVADRKRVFTAKTADQPPQVIFMFPGGGAQYPNMGRDLYDEEPLYRETIDECLTLLKKYLALDLRSLMFPPEDADLESVSQQLEQTTAALPALFITEYALARLWMAWGIQPAAMIGHSLGDYTAACLSGVMTLDEALRIVTLRGQLFETLPEGAMLSVPLAEADVRPRLPQELSLAAINGPDLCLVSGPVEAITAFETQLAQEGIEGRRLHIAVAAHSAMLDPILDDFRAGFDTIRLKPPTIPLVSNVSGDWLSAAEATDAGYWVRHLRGTVRFADGVRVLSSDIPQILLEVGPGTTLTSLARLQAGQAVTLASLRHPREQVSDLQFVLTTLGRLWLHGQPVDWDAFYADEVRRRVPLPTYPFDHQRYWIEPGKATFEASVPSLSKQPDLDDWFYEPTWSLKPLTVQPAEALRWLVFVDGRGAGKRVVRRLKAEGHTVITVQRGPEFQKLRSGDYALDPGESQGFEELVADLMAGERFPQRMLYLWTLTGSQSIDDRRVFYAHNLNAAFYGLLFLAQALSGEVLPGSLRIGVVSDGVQSVLGGDARYPEKALLLGPCRVIPRELPGVVCQSIDLEVGVDGSGPMIAELTAADVEPVVAYRHNLRFVQSFGPAAASASTNRLRDQGVYLITGGLGGIGLVLAEYLAKTVRAKLVLTSRHDLPDETRWDSWLAAHHGADGISKQIIAVRQLQALGAEVLVLAADVGDSPRMQAVLDAAHHRFGALHGVIHAAGVIDDRLIADKTMDSTARVLYPKVQGTLTLDALLAGMPLDFVVLLSSTSAVMGLAGQIDYAAANAFLDAFSHHKAADRASSWIALNWGMWQGTGMTAAAPEGDAEHYDDQVGAETGHPLLGRRLPTPDDRVIYLAAYDPQRHWILDEHRLKDGTALIPGTGYLEIARAALQSALPGKGTIQIEDLLFLSPLDVDTPRQVRVILEPRDDQTYQLSVASERDQGWQEHVLGTVSYSEMPGPEPVLIDRIRQRCPYQGVPTHQVDYLRFGPRWHNLKSIHQGVNEVLGALELADSFHDDLADYVIHPALLDIATSCGMPLIPGYTTDAPFYVPLSYKRVRLYQPVPQRMWSHVRYLNDGHSGGEIAAFDVTLLDVNGAVIAEIDEFTIKRMTNPDALIGAAVSGATARQSSSPLLDLARGVGITPEEGAQVFGRVLASRFGSQIIASSVELGALKKFTAHLNEADPASDSGIRQARPQLTGDYVAPHSPIERKLAEIWSELLGIEEVGIHDNFFDLGGHSLLAVRLFAQIRKLYQVAFSLSILFEAETIAELAERITQEGGAEASARRKAPRSRWNSLVEIQAGNPDRPRFFCMHDLNGHVLYYRDLARHLGQDQPFYALQAYGLDGSAVPDASVEAMAERYIREIRALQPRGPYYLGGSSLGGLIAFELAQRLRAQGEDVALLALFDSWSPEYLNRLSSPSPMQLPMNERVAGYWERFRTSGSAYLVERLRSRAGWTRYKLEAARLDVIGTLRDVYLRFELEMPDWMRTFHREELYARAYRSYQPAPYEGRIHLFRATDRPDGDDFDEALGWGDIAGQGVEILHSPGAHGFMVRDPHAPVLAAQLRTSLDKAASKQQS